MKKMMLIALSVLTNANAFAGAGSQNIATCSDQLGRVVTIARLTGIMGGSAGDLIANVRSKNGKLLTSAPVKFEQSDVTNFASYTSKNLKITIDSVMTMNLAINQRNGTVKLGKEKPVLMICNVSDN